jgi:hypothetical protein
VDRVEAVQVNFGEEGSTVIRDPGVWNKQPSFAPPVPELSNPLNYHAYRLQGSVDGKAWTTLADRRRNRADVPHDYIELDAPADVRFVKVIASHVPGGGPFSLRDLRVFGKAPGEAPGVPGQVEVLRGTDRRNALVRWARVPGAEGYVVRFGRTPDALYDNVQVYGDTEVSLHSLNVDTGYAFAVDALSGSGWTKATAPVTVP